MHIEEIIIDGFKSYATRTVISGWDSQFNAITGLNGTGKSNILDAICFVLGIDNLKQVRASNLQDLVYKRGQAGVSKAIVTIVFNNEDTLNSPIGFQAFKQITVARQIVIGGKNKYMINGHTVTQKAVENLFQSVQLNVNNPHFLIMQGQITKVLNMKPKEILSMIEEAAGTRMFEDRKEKALATLEKKEHKVNEISGLLQEVIQPKLDKLRKERSSFVEYQQVTVELERLQKMIVSFEYAKADEKMRSVAYDLNKSHELNVTLSSQIKQSKVALSSLTEELNRATAEREREAKSSKKFAQLETLVTELSNTLVRLKTQFDLKKSNIAEEKKAIKELNNELKELESSLLLKRQEFDKGQKQFDKSKKFFDEEARRVSKKEDLFKQLSTGVSNEDSGFDKLLQDAEAEVQVSQTEVEKLRMKKTSLEKEHKDKAPLAIQMEKEYKAASKKLEDEKASLSALEQEMEQLDFSDSGKDLLKQKATLEAKIDELKASCSTLKTQLSRVNFSFSDPTPNFNRNKVKGMVANLVSIPKEFENCANAIEVAAGGKLYFVVVDDEKTGSLLLEKGNLKKRVTIIPLTKINPYVIDKSKVEIAKKIAPNKVDIALSFVGYDKQVEMAIKYVFGSSLVCFDKETASKVAFDKRVLSRCITLEGDVYDPSGTLTGGSSNSSSSVLCKLSQLAKLKEEGLEASRSLESVNKQLSEYDAKEKKFDSLSKKIELKQHQVQLMLKQFETNSAIQLVSRLETISQMINECEVELKEAQHRIKKGEEEISRIEKESKAFKRNGDVTKLEAELVKEKAKLQKMTEEFREMEIAIQTLEFEVTEQEQEIESKKSEIIASQRALDQLCATDESELEDIEKQYALKNAELQKERSQIIALDNELKKLQDRISATADQLSSYELESKQASVEYKRLEKENNELVSIVKNLLTEHPWLRDYQSPDLSLDLKESRKRLAELESRQESVKKNVNFKVMDMIDRVEKKEQSLLQMMSQIKKDRKKIEGTITKLNDYKLDKLTETWIKVDQDFGAIFSELLPNSFAKLEPDGTIVDGLRVRVQLGGVWKPSLNELSGGQRSLVALSLILALLQYKPAPMYILDEVDSALDLSHTQNIGRLLLTRFTNSQFIIVSLKDGMFNNANVLFRTKFKEGVSSVDRIQASKGVKKKLVKQKLIDGNLRNSLRGISASPRSPFLRNKVK